MEKFQGGQEVLVNVVFYPDGVESYAIVIGTPQYLEKEARDGIADFGPGDRGEPDDWL